MRWPGTLVFFGPPDGRQQGRASSPGFTLIETLVSLMVISLIALGVAAILQTAAYGTSSQRDIRRTVVRGEQVYARIQDAIRNARAVLASGDGYLVLWTGDANADNQVNRSEIQLIELPAGSTALTSRIGQYVAGEPVYPASSDFYAAAHSAKSSGYFPETPWAGDVSNLSFTLDSPGPTARLVSWSVTMADGAVSRTLKGGASLRAPGEPE